MKKLILSVAVLFTLSLTASAQEVNNHTPQTPKKEYQGKFQCHKMGESKDGQKKCFHPKIGENKGKKPYFHHKMAYKSSKHRYHKPTVIVKKGRDYYDSRGNKVIIVKVKKNNNQNPRLQAQANKPNAK